MADGRFLSRSISLNQQLARVSFEADYLFARCIPHLDVEGRMPGHPSLVKSIACPLRDEIREADIPRLLYELASAKVDGEGLVRWYESSGVQVLEFPGFHRQQKGLRKNREAPSKLPAFSRHATDLAQAYESELVTDTLRTYSGVTPELRRITAGADPDRLRTDSGLTPAEVEGEVEVEGEEEVQEEDNPVVEEASTPIPHARTYVGASAREGQGAVSDAPTDSSSNNNSSSNGRPAEKSDDGNDGVRLEIMSLAEHYAVQLDRDACRRFIASCRVIASGADATVWRNPQTGRQVEWTERPRIFEVALAKLDAGERDTIRSALTLAIQQQVDPFPVTKADVPADSEAGRVRAAGEAAERPQSSAPRSGKLLTVAEQEREAERQAERERALIAAWEQRNPEDAEQIMRQVKAWLDGRPEWSGEKRKFAGPIIQSEYKRRVLARAQQQEADDVPQYANAVAHGGEG